MYKFITNSTGSLSYGGTCKSTTTSAIIGENTINFDIDGAGGDMPDGIYNDCVITLTDGSGFDHVLNVTPFEIVSSSIFLTEITPVNTPDNNNFPSYTFDSPISGTINYFGGCDSNTTSANIGNNTIIFNYLTAGTYNTCYISVSNGVDTSETLNISEFIILDDGPTLDSKSLVDDRLYPIGNMNFDFQYHDTGGTGIDTASSVVELYRWNGTSWGADISSSYISETSVTSTQADYNLSNLGYGKYRQVFKISSNEGVELTEETIFYVDGVEFIVGGEEVDMGDIIANLQEFGPELEITVRTVGAGFTLLLNQDSPMENSSGDTVDAFDGSYGFGFDQEAYSGTISPIGADQILGSQATSLNTNGDKNTYIFRIRPGILIDAQKAAGDYQTDLRFDIQLDY